MASTKGLKITGSYSYADAPRLVSPVKGTSTAIGGSFTVESEQGWRVSGSTAVDDSTREIAFGALSIEADGALPVDTLRKIPWAAILDLVLEAFTLPVEIIHDGDGSFTLRTTGALLASWDSTTAHRGRVGEPHLGEVARVYLEAQAEHQRPAKAVEQRFGWSSATAGRRIAAARKAGHLPPTPRKGSTDA